MYQWQWNPRTIFSKDSVTPGAVEHHHYENRIFWGLRTFHIQQQTSWLSNMGAWRRYLEPPLNYMALQNSLSFTKKAMLTWPLIWSLLHCALFHNRTEYKHALFLQSSSWQFLIPFLLFYTTETRHTGQEQMTVWSDNLLGPHISRLGGLQVTYTLKYLSLAERCSNFFNVIWFIL